MGAHVDAVEGIRGAGHLREHGGGGGADILEEMDAAVGGADEGIVVPIPIDVDKRHGAGCPHVHGVQRIGGAELQHELRV